MFDRLTRHWHELRQGEPGRRFVEEYHRRQAAARSPARRGGVLVSGVFVLVAGVFFLPAPGPGFLVIALGAAMVAQESLVAARAADWTEVRARRLVAWALRVWHEGSLFSRGLVALGALGIAAAAGWGAYWFVFLR